jgi:hypothetical protein
MGGACGTHGRGEKCVQGFGGKSRRKKTTWIRLDLREFGWGCGVDSVASGYGLVTGCYEYGDEPSVSVATELLTYLCNLLDSKMLSL